MQVSGQSPPTAYRSFLLVYSNYQNALKKLGINESASHAFRHGNITEMDRMGTPMAVRKSRFGHADDATTMKYTHLVSSDARATAEALGKLYKPIDLEDMEPKGGTQ